MDGVLSLHELMHHAHVKKQVGFIFFKVTLERLMIRWLGVLLSCFSTRSISELSCLWTTNFLHNSTMSVKLNNEIGLYFRCAKG
jgi:hypothetical protein